MNFNPHQTGFLQTRDNETALVRRSLFWLGVSALVGVLSGSASALFLFALEKATAFRESHPWMIFLLPLGGLGIGLLYHLYGKSVEGGNNLILDEIHDAKEVIPFRMSPLVLIGTVATHLFGGSAGREGTAIQMGGSLADQLTKPLKLSPSDRQILLIAGLSAGFASVFGTPMAGTIFGLEVLMIGRMRSDAIFPAVIAAIIGHQVCLAWGIHHTVYSVGAVPAFSLPVLASVIVAGLAFGIIGRLFAGLVHRTSHLMKLKIPYAPLRPVVGGIIFVALFAWPVMHRYIGLGIPSILAAFQVPVAPYDFMGKIVATVITLGSGFKGGEVTPLFYIGATAGNALSLMLPVALPVLAGLGFVAVFAGAANVPIASTLLAIELFGSDIGWLAALACVLSYMASGKAGIYRSQRTHTNKHGRIEHDEI